MSDADRFPTPRARRTTLGAFWWLVLFAVTHVAALFLPVDGGDGPWGATAFYAYDAVLIAMSCAGAWLVLSTLPGRDHRRLPRWMVLAPLWFGSALLLVRGVPGMAENLLIATRISPGGVIGLLDRNAPDPAAWDQWKSIAINTAFFLGALLLTPVAARVTRGSGSDVRVEGVWGRSDAGKIRR